MTLGEMIEKRKELERRISDAITEFESATGCNISRITDSQTEITKLSDMSARYEHHIHVEVML